MSIYYDEIHRRADAATWKRKLESGEVTFEEWKEHWLNVADDWRKECVEQGLNQTSNYIAEIIWKNQ